MKKAERLAKLEAWKHKLAAERESKLKEQSSGGTRTLLDEMDKKAEAVSIVTRTEPSASEDVVIEDLREEDPSPAQYAGKFDPKAIAKKASAASNSSTKLGLDVALPQHANVSVNPAVQSNGMKANNPIAPIPQNSSKSTSVPISLPLLTIVKQEQPCH